MNLLKAIIIDDEPTAIDKLLSLLKDNDKINIVGTFTEAKKATELAKDVDLIFLDIHMPNINGIDFAKKVKTKAEIIFTTAHSQYTLDSYDLGAIGYLLKPIDELKLTDLINKVFSIVFTQKNESFSKVNFEIPNEMIVVNDGAYRTIIKHDEILYGKAYNGKVIIKINNDNITINETLNGLLSRLPSSTFIRTHNSSFVNKNFVLKVDRNQIYLRGCKETADIIDLSRSQEKEFWDKIESK
jgi:two-component system, LytTR family, response regulator